MLSMLYRQFTKSILKVKDFLDLKGNMAWCICDLPVEAVLHVEGTQSGRDAHVDSQTPIGQLCCINMHQQAEKTCSWWPLRNDLWGGISLRLLHSLTFRSWAIDSSSQMLFVSLHPCKMRFLHLLLGLISIGMTPPPQTNTCNLGKLSTSSVSSPVKYSVNLETKVYFVHGRSPCKICSEVIRDAEHEERIWNSVPKEGFVPVAEVLSLAKIVTLKIYLKLTERIIK